MTYNGIYQWTLSKNSHLAILNGTQCPDDLTPLKGESVLYKPCIAVHVTLGNKDQHRAEMSVRF